MRHTGPPKSSESDETPQSDVQTSRDRRSQLQLLVVEDNRTNQAVALGLLKQLGYRADVAADGQSALRALAHNNYELVLLDCQLPDIDGYEIARHIRRSDAAVRNHNIAIIATTAHTSAGDAVKCLDAGMNGYLSKPLRLDALERAIEQAIEQRTVVEPWTSVARVPVDPAPPPALSPNPEAAAFDREDFVERLMGNEDLARRIAQGFVDDMPLQLAALARAVNDRDAPAVRLVAHSIRGAAANVSGLEIREVARKLEQSGDAGDLTAAAAALPELSASFERARPILEKFCHDASDE